ncbi:MAG: DUF86 domain-containing protein [Chloroflexia bacterium]|nr:DUF86 domain-containing protein [Chloroflexia bacterium]
MTTTCCRSAWKPYSKHLSAYRGGSPRCEAQKISLPLRRDESIWTRSAWSFCLVGEAFRQINEKTQGEFLKQYPEIPWRAVIGMRNILAHDYFDVNEKVIFNTCEAHITPLMNTVRRMLADLETDS